jgi:hypothetical protein
MDTIGITKQWLVNNRDPIESYGFRISLTEYGGGPMDPITVIDMDAIDVVAQFHIFETGMVFCYISAPQIDDVVSPQTDLALPVTESLDRMWGHVVSYCAR